MCIRCLIGEWWKNHILQNRNGEHANVAYVDDPLTLYEAIRCSDASKWEMSMQEKYESLMANGTWKLTPFLKEGSSVGCQWVFRSKRDA